MTVSVYSEISANKKKTWIIMAFFVSFIAMIGFMLGKTMGSGMSWFVFALLLATFSSLVSYFFGDKFILNLSKAHEADRKRDFDLYTVVENMAIAAGIPKPKVYIIEESPQNAFATGRDPKHAVICLTRGLMEKLNRSELEGVIAHEMSHIGNLDIRLMAITAVLVGTLAFMSEWFMRSLWWGGRGRNRDDRSGGGLFLLLGILLSVLSPVIAIIIQLSVSRRREFLADASGVLLTRNPDGLIHALEKISSDKEKLSTASNATAHLYIANPFKGKDSRTFFSGLFDTHPPIEERIKILKAM